MYMLWYQNFRIMTFSVAMKIDSNMNGFMLNFVIKIKSMKIKRPLSPVHEVLTLQVLAPCLTFTTPAYAFPDSKVHGDNMGLIRGRQDPGGPHVGSMDLAIWVITSQYFAIRASTGAVLWNRVSAYCLGYIWILFRMYIYICKTIPLFHKPFNSQWNSVSTWPISSSPPLTGSGDGYFA